jgi:hypothetical protein
MQALARKFPAARLNGGYLDYAMTQPRLESGSFCI